MWTHTPRLPSTAAEPSEKADGFASLLRRFSGRLERAVGMLPMPRPWMILAVLVACNWLVTVDAARLAAHRGWYYYDGGDGTWYYTSAWVLAHGHIPLSAIGYGYPLLIAPLARIAGPSMLAGLPLVLLVNAIVLSPLVLLSVYALTKAIGGVRFACTSAVLWVVLPLAAMHYFYPTYHTQYVDVALPDAVGLTAVGDYPSMLCVLVAAYFAYRALYTGSRFDALTAGLAAGIALGVKPANGLFLLAPFIAFAVARRPRQLVLFAAGLVPSVVALALWKYRGLGTLPVFASNPLALAAGPRSVPPMAGLSVEISKYLHFNWADFKQNLDGFREWGWSKRLLEWFVFGGLIGLARRSLSGAVLVAVWFGSYLLVKGSVFSMAAGDFLTHLLPALPALFVLGVSVMFLIPIYGRRPLSTHARASWPQSARSRRQALAVLAFLAVVPIGIFTLLQPLTQPAAADLQTNDLYVPANQFPLSARATVGAVDLRWPGQKTNGTHADYAIFRTSGDGVLCAPIANATTFCSFDANPVATIPSSSTSFVDYPGAGQWSYRVALQASAYGPRADGNTLLLSAPVSVTLGP